MPRQLVSTPDTLGGTLRFDGTRIPVRMIGFMVWRGQDFQQILEDYPALDAEDLENALNYLSWGDKWQHIWSRPWGSRAKLLTVWFSNFVDHHILGHRVRPFCHWVAHSPWWGL